MLDAAPPDFARKHGLERIVVDGVVAIRCREIPFVHFNNVLNLGIPAPADERLLDELLALYAWHGEHHTAHVTSLRARSGWV